MSKAARDLYAVLGVARSASPEEIRRAYRRAARAAHPDSVAGERAASEGTAASGIGDMAEINAAWSVLSDPVRRAAHDASLDGARDVSSEEPSHVAEQPWPVRSAAVPTDGPARIPWRAMRWMLVIGVMTVIALSLVSPDARETPPDQLLQPGSCVTFDDTAAAVEVSCSLDHDAVVRRLVGFDGTCPADTEARRDRQGLGLACVVPAVGDIGAGG